MIRQITLRDRTLAPKLGLHYFHIGFDSVEAAVISLLSNLAEAKAIGNAGWHVVEEDLNTLNMGRDMKNLSCGNI